MSRKTIALAVLLTGLAAGAAAQGPEHSGPPPVLAIGREEIKPGRMGAHEKLNVGFVSALSKTPSRSYWLGLVPISGDDNSTLFVSAFGSFAEVEAQRKADEELMTNVSVKAELDALDKQGADLHAAQRTSYARHRADLSYHPLSAEDIAQSRYFGITTVRVKPGRIDDYLAGIKAVRAAWEKAGYPLHLAVYQVTTGAQPGTFLSFRALKSLKEWDDDAATLPQFDQAVTEALGGAEAEHKVTLAQADAIASMDRAAYAMNPKISRPAPEFAKYDVAFWAPKPLDTRTAAVAKPGATKQPASAKKEAPKQ
jgi:hypothetical protein